MKISISFILRLIVAIILIQSLYFKFTGHSEAVHVFSTLGVEPWGRIGLGCVELIVGLLLLFPKTHIKGSFLAVGILLGALGAHLFTPLGIVVRWEGQSDGGQLFTMAAIGFLFALINILIVASKTKTSLFQLIQKEFLSK